MKTWGELILGVFGRSKKFLSLNDICNELNETPFALGKMDKKIIYKVLNENSSDWNIIDERIYGEREYDTSGTSVSISGDGKRIAVGATDWNNGKNYDHYGIARVYKNIEGKWTKVGSDIYQVNDSVNHEGDFAGKSVSLSNDGTILAVGAPFAGGAVDSVQPRLGGEIRVYKESNGNWNQLGNDIAFSETDSNIRFLEIL